MGYNFGMDGFGHEIPAGINGISLDEVRRRLSAEGYNELLASKPKSIFTIAYGVAREPMFLLLVACGAIYLLLGDREEALMLLGFVFVVMGITFYQERKTERSLEALRDLSSPRALVIREGERKRIPGREVVRGDIVILSEGDRVPADGELLSSVNLMVDESLLTGEPVPVRKSTPGAVRSAQRPGGDDLPWVFSGTLVVHGQGFARVTATGLNSELGRIGKSLRGIQPSDSPLQVETRRVVRVFAGIGLALFALVVGVYGMARGDWVSGLLAGLTMAMSILPEEIPVILTVFLALGAWRISRKRVLMRNVPALEALGAATVLCVDKTGTLTQNRMTIKRLYAEGRYFDVEPGGSEPLPEHFHRLVEFSILAGKKDPFDPMEKAFLELGEYFLKGSDHIHEGRVLLREYPLTKKFLAFTHVWGIGEGSGMMVASKGAPETIAGLCHLDESRRAEVERHAAAMASGGLRVLGVAMALLPPGNPLPENQHGFDLSFVGLVGFSDPVRPGVSESVKECYEAGIRVVMITGDYPATAQSVAAQVGLSGNGLCIAGEELERMGDEELKERIREANIFARVIPEQKLRIVNALKANGEIVGMTGDGVNDAPALKSAHIGIAMGERGTDVARESASLVLTDDDFSSIVSAVRQGRRIFDNIKKAMGYTIAVHVPIAGMSLIPVFSGLPLVFLPMHIAFLELIIDPACSIVFEAEPEEADVMARPPRKAGVPLFGGELVFLSVLLGVGVLALVFSVYAVALFRGQEEGNARALAFTTLIISNISLILTNRSWVLSIYETVRRPNAALWWLLCGAFLFLGMVLYLPFLRGVFRFSFLHPEDLGVCILAGTAGIFWFEALKYFRRHRRAAKAD